MRDSRLIFQARKKWVGLDGIEISGVERHNDGSMGAIEGLTHFPVDAGTEVHPFMEMTTAEAVGLMDELWNLGIRPSDGNGSAGQLAATEKHLEDMRTIAFKGLGLIQVKVKP